MTTDGKVLCTFHRRHGRNSTKTASEIPADMRGRLCEEPLTAWGKGGVERFCTREGRWLAPR